LDLSLTQEVKEDEMNGLKTTRCWVIRFAAIVICMVFSLHIAAQQDQSFIVKGTVVDAADGLPLIGVNVFLAEGQNGASRIFTMFL